MSTNKVTKKDRITHLELQVGWLTNVVHELRGTENLEFQPQLKQLDQSIFDGLDEKWRFAIVSSVGIPFVYDYKPTGERVMFSDDATQQKIKAGKVMRIDEYDYDTSNWQNSLIERDTATELTGSELCRAMLERGDKFVMCLLSDMSHAGALSSSKPRLITNFIDGKGFIEDPKDLYWQHAVPINNQGEPLTASEVGL